VYSILALFQLIAVIAGLEHWIGLHWIIAVPLGFFIVIVDMPLIFTLVGMVIGMFGAVISWHWSWLQAGMLFFGAVIVDRVVAQKIYEQQ